MLPKDIEHLYKKYATSDEVRSKIQAAIGEHDELLAMARKRKLRSFGHVLKSSILAKIILQDRAKGIGKR